MMAVPLFPLDHVVATPRTLALLDDFGTDPADEYYGESPQGSGPLRFRPLRGTRSVTSCYGRESAQTVPLGYPHLIRRGNGGQTVLYLGRMTKEMLRRRPYLSRSKKPMRRFWRKHVPGEPVPEGLMEEVA